MAITRARSSLFVLGNAMTLKQNALWSRVLEDSQNRGLFSEVTAMDSDERIALTSSLPGHRRVIPFGCSSCDQNRSRPFEGQAA